MTRKLASLALTSLAATFALYGCGSDSGSNAKSNEKEAGDEAIEVESYDDLSACTAKKQGMIVTVTEDETDYYCYATEWIETVASAKKLPDCTAKKEGDMVFISGSEEVAVCQGEEWITTGTDEEEDDDDDGKSSASKDSGKSSASKDDGKSSESNSESGEKVEFVDGVIWQPSYGKRAWTNAEGVDENNFSDEGDDEEAPGWWYKYVDLVPSQASGKFTDEFLKLDFSLNYKTWKTKSGTGVDDYGDTYTYYWYEPETYPYAGFGFSFDKDPVSMLKFAKDGLCVTYSSTTPIRFQVTTKALEDYDADYQYILSASSAVRTENIAWTKFELPSWFNESVSSVSTAIANTYAIHFVYSNDESGVTKTCGSKSVASCETAAETYKNSTLKIYKIGKYGKCDDADSDL